MKKRFLIITGIMIWSISSLMGCGKNTSHSLNTEVELPVIEEETGENIPDTAEELLVDALDSSMVAEEEATPSEKLTNTIINATYVKILEDNGDSCKLEITYPDVKTAFIEAFEMLPEEVSEEQMNVFYAGLEEMVLGEEVEILTVTVEMDIARDENGHKYLEWTREGMSATTGGLSELFFEELENN